MYGRVPLVRLQWDPGDYGWRDPYLPNKEFSFFQYTANLRRHTLMASKRNGISAQGYWRSQGLEQDFISAFWKKFWNVEQARKIMIFHWLVVYRAVPVKEWIKVPNVSAICRECGMASEPIRHFLWDCKKARFVWIRMLRIFQFQKMWINVSWGSVVWMTMSEKVYKYDSVLGSANALGISHQQIQRMQISLMRPNIEIVSQLELWTLLSNSTIWYI